jgi:hypothetical protein
MKRQVLLEPHGVTSYKTAFFPTRNYLLSLLWNECRNGENACKRIGELSVRFRGRRGGQEDRRLEGVTETAGGVTCLCINYDYELLDMATIYIYELILCNMYTRC